MALIVLLYNVKSSVLLLLCFVCFHCNAQDENWDSYVATFKGRPGSILVNMGLAGQAPDKRYPYLVVTGPHSQQCKANGLPANEEIPALEEILDATSSFLNGVTANVLVGTFTFNCQRLNYYYVRDTVGVYNALNRMYNQSYKGYKYSVKVKPDADWISYRTFLYPDEKMRQWMSNSKVIAGMLKTGDSLSTPRDLNFTLYFKNDTGRRTFSEYARANSYKVDTFSYTDDKYRFGITVSKYGYVKVDIINMMEEELKAEIKKYEAMYSGWDAILSKRRK